MTLGDCLIHSVLIIGTVRHERCDWIANLVEQCAGARSVIDVFFRQFDRDNFTASGINADMQLTPGPTTRCAVLMSHSPAPPSLRPVLSTRRWSGPVSDRRSGGRTNVLLRRHIVE
jgi:hypothetical protein